MIVTLIVELEDKPGQLLKVIEPISKMGGNIISVVHDRHKISPMNRVPVEFVIDIDSEKLESLVERIRSAGIHIRSYNEVRLLATASFLLIGHIIHTDLSDTVNRIDETGFAEVVELHITMPKLNEPSTALVTISARGKEELRKAVSILREVCEKKDILVIEPLNEDLL
ncbi:ACT domain-containing protein [Geoglobus sp.]